MTTQRIPYSACPLCCEHSLRPLRTDDARKHAVWQPPLPPVMNWLKCANCGHVFTDGYFGPDAFRVLFSKTQKGQSPGDAVESNRFLSSGVVEWLQSVSSAPHGERWLDVGVGAGGLLTTAHELGYSVVGLEPRLGATEYFSGYEVLPLTLGQFAEKFPDQAGTFGVVSMNDVLEHVPYPVDALKQAHGLLGFGGMLYLSTPNRGSFAWRKLDAEDANPYWYEIEHFHIFDRKGLELLFEKTGFRLTRVRVNRRYRLGIDVLAQKLRPGVMI